MTPPLTQQRRDDEHRETLDHLLASARAQGAIRDDETEWSVVESPAILWRALHLAIDVIDAQPVVALPPNNELCTVCGKNLYALGHDELLCAAGETKTVTPPPGSVAAALLPLQRDTLLEVMTQHADWSGPGSGRCACGATGTPGMMITVWHREHVADALHARFGSPPPAPPAIPPNADMEFFVENGEVGDCVRACTATMLGLPRESVPHFVREYDDWKSPWKEWLREQGWAVLELDPRSRPACTYLGCGPTVRTKEYRPAAHMVVMDHDALLHDPHPSRAGLTTLDRVYVFLNQRLAVGARPQGGTK